MSRLASEDFSGYDTDQNIPVRLFDVGSFKSLKKGEVVDDGMEHDHIPSLAAIKKYVAQKMGVRRLAASSTNTLRNNTTQQQLRLIAAHTKTVEHGFTRIVPCRAPSMRKT